MDSNDLTPWLTLATPARCADLKTVTDAGQLSRMLAGCVADGTDWMILGGGSNLVFEGDYRGVVLRMATRGVITQSLAGGQVRVSVEAGEPWPDLVWRLTGSGLGGLENLARIPGTAGAAPVQNIGAYGVELADVLEAVDVLDANSGKAFALTREECRLRYRDSIFKTAEARHWVIVRIHLRLMTRETWTPRLAYGDLAERHRLWGHAMTPLGVARTVDRIRREKLPDPRDIPNVGSFFKNPFVSLAQFEALKAQYPSLPGYPAGQDEVKLPAAWLIEQAGWKGRLEGGVGMSERQALVLVNPGRRPGRDVLAVAEAVRRTVEARFGIRLETEPRVVPAA